MPKYRIVIKVDGSRVDFVKKQCLTAFGIDISTQVAKIESQPSRTDRLNEAEGWVSDAKGVVEELRGEMEDWKENMPESLQQGSKADDIDECVSQLEEIESMLGNIDFGNVSFPSMM
jgi:hypothetical protein